MKRIAFSILGAAVLLGAGACDGGGTTQLLPGGGATPWSPDSLAAGPQGTFDHPLQPTGGENGVTDPIVKTAEDSRLGPPEVAARLHGAQKLPVSSLATLLADLGVDMTSQTPGSAAQLFAAGQSALGGPVYASRVPEMVLHILALAGGSLGAWLGMRLFRHKTVKGSFRLAFWLIVSLQVLLVAWVAHLLWQHHAR